MEQLDQLAAALTTLPPGSVRSHFLNEVSALRAARLAPLLLPRSVARRAAAAAQPLELRSARAALALAVHCALLDAGLEAERQAPAAIVPEGWSPGGDEGGSFSARYAAPWAGGAAGPVLVVALLSVGGATLALQARAEPPPSSAQSQHAVLAAPEPAIVQLELDASALTSGGGGGAAAAAAPFAPITLGGAAASPDWERALESALAPLARWEVSDGLVARLHSKVVAALLPPRAKADGAEAKATAAPPHAAAAAAPYGERRPGNDGLRGPGDFERDLVPDMHAGRPGFLLGGGMGEGPGLPGNLVGPDHPIFGGGGRGGLGRFGGGGIGPGLGQFPQGMGPALGVPPGARFDPFGPPGAMRGGRGGFGGGRAPPAFGPNPDHLPPPRDDAPPDSMYW